MDNDKKIIKSPYYSLEDIKKYSDVLKRGLEDLGISITDPKNQEDATEFAKLLFVLWVGDFMDSKSFLSFSERYKNESELIQSKFLEKYLVYLFAGIAIVLTNEYGKQADEKIKQHIIDTLVEFKKIVWQVMEKIFGLSQDDIDEVIINAGLNYSKLLDTNPNEHPGFSFTWAMEWFNLIEIKDRQVEMFIISLSLSSKYSITIQ